ncbi:MAG: hypothetical protein DMG24_12120 [Acidobacteria bacterium]|nr:MAG: hypothetical protein DMG24_12120 [Acidobacteriota bacterium]
MVKKDRFEARTHNRDGNQVKHVNARKSRNDAKGEKKKEVATVSAFLTVGSCGRQKPTVGTKPTVGKAPTAATDVDARAQFLVNNNLWCFGG